MPIRRRSARTAASGLRARKKQAVRDRILAVCGRLFRTRGFDETTVDDIVGKVGVSRQTFFNYFPGKDAVLAELGLVWLREQAELTRRRRPSSAGGGIRSALRDQFVAIEKDRDFMRLVFTRSGLFFPHGAHVGSPADEWRLDHTRRYFAAVADFMRAAQKAGQIRRDLPAEQVAEIYVAVLATTTRLWLTGYWGDTGSLVARAMRAFDALGEGLRAREESG